MKRTILSIMSVAAACLMTSCFQNETTLRLNKDGSGTLTEETSFGPQVIEMLSQLGGGLGGGSVKSDPLGDLSSDVKAKEHAAKLGEGVTVEKVEKISKDGWQGARVTYHFADINKLKFVPGGGTKDSMPSMPGEPPKVEKAAKPIVFKYAAGKLSISVPEPEKAEAPAPEPQETGPEQEEMAKQMLKGMRMGFKIIIVPGIAQTNASIVEGDTITMYDVEFSKILDQPGGMKELSKMGQDDPTQALEMMKKFPGVKFETNRELTVTVK